MQGEDLKRKARALKLNSHSPDCALLLTPEMAGSACGPARTVHMDTSKESTEMRWHFSLSWVNCAWRTLKSHLLNKEETEQWSDCNIFLLKHRAAEATRSGSDRCLCWTKGIKSKWIPRCCVGECAKVQWQGTRPLWLSWLMWGGSFFLAPGYGHGTQGNSELCWVSPLLNPSLRRVQKLVWL